MRRRKKPRILQTPKAKDDLINIWLYTFEEWGEKQADKYLNEIETNILQLRDNPWLGRGRDDIRRDYRSLVVSQHIVFYKIIDDAIHIIRVLHMQMDPDLHI